MSIVAFKLTGDYAHFSHPATIYSSLTYPVPPKTAIMGFLGAVIGEDDYAKLGKIRYSVKVDREIVKKSFVFNGIKFALSKNMHIKEGYQNASEKKQFYRELICAPEYTIFLDLSDIEISYQERVIGALKKHQTKYTPYLGVNFCIADFEWIVIEKAEKIDDAWSEIDTFTRKEDFEFDIDNYDVKLTTANMACGVEEGRVFKDFQEFIVEISGQKSIKSKNRNNIFQVNNHRVYFV